MVDTGYNGALTLPRAIVSTLSLSALAPGVITLADGTQSLQKFFEAEVTWDDTPRTIRVLELESVPLLGTALLEGHRLTADFLPGREVIISSLS